MPYSDLISRSATTCNVERQAPAADATGADAPIWAARLTGIKCIKQPYFSRRGVGESNFNRDDSLVLYQVFTQSDIAATTEDRLLIGTSYYAVLSSLPIDGIASGENVYRTLVSKRN